MLTWDEEIKSTLQTTAFSDSTFNVVSINSTAESFSVKEPVRKLLDDGAPIPVAPINS